MHTRWGGTTSHVPPVATTSAACAAARRDWDRKCRMTPRPPPCAPQDAPEEGSRGGVLATCGKC
eukprot:1306244-Prymnesium_polylepis.1